MWVVEKSKDNDESKEVGARIPA